MEQAPDIAIIIPAYNEDARLESTLQNVVDYFEHRKRQHQVIVVDDGSTDGTSALAERFRRSHPQLQVVRLPKNSGKGNAVREGMRRAIADRTLFTDADGSTPIEEFARLERAIDAGADVAIGSRAMSSADTVVETSWRRKIIGRIFNSMVNLLLLPGFSDTQCGFKIFTRQAANFLFNKQTSTGFSFDVEILFLARKAGLQVVEVPVNWTNQPNSKVHILRDSVKMFFDILRFTRLHHDAAVDQTALAWPAHRKSGAKA